MKKFLIAAISLIIVLSLCACGGKEKSKSPESMAAEAAKSYVMFKVSNSYDIEGLPNITTYTNSTGDNEYEVTGKVTVKDKYGDSYTGKYDAVVTYNPDTDKCSVTECNVDTLYKD